MLFGEQEEEQSFESKHETHKHNESNELVVLKKLGSKVNEIFE